MRSRSVAKLAEKIESSKFGNNKNLAKTPEKNSSIEFQWQKAFSKKKFGPEISYFKNRKEERQPKDKDYERKTKYQIVSALADINGTMNEFARQI